MNIKIVFLATAAIGFAYGFYSQSQALKYISKEKINQLKDVSRIASGPMPPKEILSEEGQRYHKGFYAGLVIFAVSLIALLMLTAI